MTLPDPRPIRSDLLPHEVVRQLRDAMHDRYPGQIWRWRDDPAWMDLDSGTVSPLGVQRWRALVPEAAYLAHPFDASRHTSIPRTRADDAFHHPELAPRLAGVRWCPWVDAAGDIHTAPGLHDDTYLHWTGPEADPDAISDDDIHDVLARLTDLPFARDTDRLHYLGLLLGLVRHTPGVPRPLHLITAELSRSGKTLAAELAGAIQLGRVPEPAALPEGPERGYTLNALVLQEPGFLWLENLQTGSELGGVELLTALTAPGPVRVRAVRSSSTVKGDPTRTVWVATGNQIQLGDEQARRTVLINLRRRTDRAFRTPDLRAWVLANRWRIVSCLLALVRRWHQRGEPEPDRALDSFERWSRLVGGPAWHELPGGSAQWLRADARPKDPVDTDLERLLEAWPSGRDQAPLELGAREIVATVDVLELDALQRRIEAPTERGRSTSMGMVLRTQVARGLLEARRRRNGVKYWPCRSAEPPTPPGPRTRPSSFDRSTTVEPPLRGHRGTASAPATLALGAEPRCGPVITVTHADGRLASDDPSIAEIEAMARRGVRVDVAEWQGRLAIAEATLRTANDEASVRRRAALLRYGPAVLAQAITHPEGRVFASRVLEASGRIRTSDPHLASITRAYGLRLAVVPAEGHVFLRADWCGAHLWLAAGLSGDAALAADLVADDPYAGAIEAFAADVAHPEAARRVAKQCLLRTLNGAGARSIATALADAGLDVDEREAGRRRRAILDRYPVLTGWLQTEGAAGQPRTWTTPLGRTATMPTGSATHARVGSLVQSWEADALRLVLRRYPGRIVLTAHDEVLAEEPASLAERRLEELRDVMDAAMLQIAGLDGLAHPSTCSIDVRPSWGGPASTHVPTEAAA